ncbi:DUF1980 domain-containing protein [Actinomadura spongiicola]|uniref:DUF1980 domain-containing protein n=1 Tax=Actinomadura spongiicola TaxID=2303421 RepID=A0A372GD73_9ACTN|nr:DUF1980 domain-containing protein [Actinomadura spongiicola]RFS83335.1 DUF1980 domain-containing protein [Actinomadura spongiicola]
MSRAAQNMLLIMVAAAMLWITLGSGEYVNYVRPGFRFLLVPAASALLVLGAAGLRREWRHTAPADHGHDHSRGPRAAWLLCLPILAVFLVAPPALGSFTVSRDTGRAAPPPVRPDEGFERLPTSGAPISMTMQEFLGRAWEAQNRDPSALAGVPVRLTGFVAPARQGGWHVTRLRSRAVRGTPCRSRCACAVSRVPRRTRGSRSSASGGPRSPARRARSCRN